MTLSLKSLAGGYGDTLIHRGISLEVGEGEVIAVVGRNGMGKTTLARMIAGEVPLQSGQILLDDQSIETWPAWYRARAGIASMGQTGFAFDSLTVAENLALTQVEPEQLDVFLTHFPRLKERMKQIAGSMSGGERKILGFVRTLLLPSKVLILDEPSEGVQPENIEKMQICIEAQCSQGKSIILMEQNISMVEATANSALLITDKGKTRILSKNELNRDDLLNALRI